MQSRKEKRQRAKAAQLKFRRENPVAAKAIADAYIARRRAILHDAKSKPCHDCGKSYPPYVMDFDHREPSDKNEMVSQLYRRNIKSLLAEIDKCDVVCANCHRERTHLQGF